jgi:hypothetical protein
MHIFLRGAGHFGHLMLCTVFFLLRMYPLILSFETINKLKLFFECGIPRPQEVGHLCFTEKSHFSSLNVGLAGSGNRTRLPCVAGSVARHSAIYYV